MFFCFLISFVGGIGDWGLGPIPNPQSPIPNPHEILIKFIPNNKETIYF
jgi:hypothetical protein